MLQYFQHLSAIVAHHMQFFMNNRNKQKIFIFEFSKQFYF